MCRFSTTRFAESLAAWYLVLVRYRDYVSFGCSDLVESGQLVGSVILHVGPRIHLPEAKSNVTRYRPTQSRRVLIRSLGYSADC